ncbi:hypothetical protein RRG08_062650 [Elysia crispata]|uniref:Uncharacterized protein n=1 Tax=Elysia crispata TaxID=231223 RepID=A0AAE0YYA3_9GAST|nr:hypothetical protein RRG08_062650 [Elysia crispata]
MPGLSVACSNHATNNNYDSGPLISPRALSTQSFSPGGSGTKWRPALVTMDPYRGVKTWHTATNGGKLFRAGRQ